MGSRRDVERLIAEGKVALNGQVLTSPAVNVGPGDILTVNGEVVGDKEPTRLWRYHKPVGLLTSHKDPKGRPTVFDHLPDGLPRVISIGRLDLASEGLLLLTNDGALARALEQPSTGWVRRYRVRAYGHATQARLDGLKDGVTVEGVRYGPIEAKLDKVKHAAADIDRKGPANIWITVAITEGKNREVRRVMESIGLKVNRLIRLAYGPFALATLPIGAVEEVGPRVIREQLADLIAPELLPKGDKAQPMLLAKGRVPSRPGTGEGAVSRRAPVEPAPKKEYKAGWARPKKRDPAKPGPKPKTKPAAKGAARPSAKPPAHATDLTFKPVRKPSTKPGPGGDSPRRPRPPKA